MADTEKANSEISISNKQKNIFKSGKFWIIGIIVIAVVLTIVKLASPKKAGKDLSVSEVVLKDMVQSISVEGNVDAKQDDLTLLNVSQKVEKVMVGEGQDVKAGTPLVKLDTTDLEYQLKKAVVSLNTAKENYENGKKQASDAVTQAEASVQKAQGDYNQAMRKFGADQGLFKNGHISKEEYEASKKQTDDLSNQLKTATMKLQAAQKDLKDYDKSSQFKQQLDLCAVDVDNLNKKIADSTIVSNIDGRVVRIDAKAGKYPQADKNIVLVCDLSSYKLVVSLNQYDSTKIKVGQKASIKVKGLDKKYTGTISHLGEMANTVMDGTNKETKVNMEMTIDNPDKDIKVGYEADADIILGQKNGVINVSFDDVKQDDKGRYVFVVQDGKAAKRYIKTGLETDFDVEVTEGLKVGEKYISSPDETLKEGDMVSAPYSTKK